jgi:hypothetical protein
MAPVASTAHNFPVRLKTSGITFAGSHVTDNIWISDGATEATIPGTYLLGNPVDFAYGFDNGDGTST